MASIPSPIQKAEFYEQLATYVRSGFGIENALDSLTQQPGLSRGVRYYLQVLSDGLRGGDSIHAALVRLGPSITSLETRFISAGERSGQLEDAFSHLGQHFRTVAECRKEMRASLAYPITLFHFALLVGVGASGIFALMLPESQGEGKGVLEAVLRAGSWAAGLYLLVVMLVYASWRLAKSAHRNAGADRLLRKLPLVGPALKAGALSRFCAVFRMHLLAAFRMSQSLEASLEAAESGLFLEVVAELPKRIEGDQTLSQVMQSRGDLFPDDFVRAITTAEEAGQMDATFNRWTAFYREQSVEQARKLARRLPKVFYVFAVVLTVGIVLGMGFQYIGVIEGWLDWSENF